MVKEGLLTEVTFGQRPDHSEEVSHGMSVGGASPVRGTGPEAGVWLEYSGNRGEVGEVTVSRAQRGRASWDQF